MTRRIGGLVLVLVALGIGFGAGLWLAAPEPAPAAGDEAAVFVARPGSVSQSVPGTATIAWEVAEQVDVPAEGRVTAGLPAGGRVKAGSTLLTVDEQPVIVLPGDVPAYRELAPGDHGQDVRQLQDHLAGLGYRLQATGEFGPATAAAVSAWSAKVGWPTSTRVPLGRVVFLPDLPARVAPAEGLRVGGSVPSPTIEVLAGAPSITVSVNLRTAEQASAGDAVQLQATSGPVPGTLTGASVANPDGSVSLVVDPESVDCARACPAGRDEPLVMPATVELVAPTEGIVVPASAVAAAADGGSFVVLEDGTRQPVEVTASADGMAVVSGVAEGQRIRLGP